MHFKVLPEITEKQKEIVDMVWKFRFINRHQIQKMFKYKSPRRLNEWLKDLVSKGYLGRIYSHKLLENTKPAIYYLMNNGIIFERWRNSNDYGPESKDMKKFYDDRSASEVFINHHIAICDLYQQFMALTGKEWEYEGWTRNDLWTHEVTEYKRKEGRLYLPDLNIERTNNKDDDDYRSETHIIELFDPQVPIYALEAKVRKYFEMYGDKNSEYYWDRFEEFPLILMFIFPNRMKLNRIKRFLEEEIYDYADTEFLSIKLTTYTQVTQKGPGDGTIWRTVGEDKEEE